MPDGESILSFRDICLSFPSCGTVLDRVSADFFPGTINVIAGPNGAGKTVLMKTSVGLHVPDSGTVKVKGRIVATPRDLETGSIAYLFQDADSQIIGDSVRGDVAIGPRARGMRRNEVERKVTEALSAVNLLHKADSYTFSLSGGEKRRLAIAGALSCDADTIIMDEPFANLDYPMSGSLLRVLLDLRASGHCVIVVTHETEKILAHADRLIVLRLGRLTHDISPLADPLPDLRPFGLRIWPGLELAGMSWLDGEN